MALVSINELTTYRWTFEEDVAHYLAVGFKGIGVWRQKLCDFGEEKGIELIHDSGLAVSNLLWAGGFTGSDGRSYRDSIEDASEAIELSGLLRCNCLIVYSGGRAGHTHNHARRLLVGALTELAPLAAEHGVTLAVEPMHPGCAAEWTFLHTVADALDVIDRVESPAIRLAFDTYHFGGDSSVCDALEDIADRIAVVHLGDGKEAPDGEQNRCPLGQGTIPLTDIVASLKRGGYQGYFDVELMGQEIECSAYDELLSQSKAACDRLLV